MAEGRGTYVDFISRLCQGDHPEATLDELDALLHWLAGRDNTQANAIESAFQAQGLGRDTARRRTLAYLDFTLFSHDADPYRLFGLSPTCDFSEIRARHKHLLQVFHPDRHEHDKAWFTERSERINRAYGHLRTHHGKPQTEPPQPVVTPAPPATRRPQRRRTPTSAPIPWQSLFANKDRLRRQLQDYLGDPAHLQKRIYIVLIAMPVILFVVIYVYKTGLGEQSGELVVANVQESPVKIDVASQVAPSSSQDLDDAADAVEQPIPVSPTDQSVDSESNPTEPGKAAAAPVTVWAAAGPLPDYLAATPWDNEPSMPATVADEEAPQTKEQSGATTTWELNIEEQGATPPAASPNEDDAPQAQMPESEVDSYASLDKKPIDAAADDAVKRKNEPGSSNGDLTAIKTFLNTYQAAYNVSNIEQFTNLFRPNATTKHASNRAEIARSYESLFNRTRDRKLVFNDVQFERMGIGEFKVNTTYVVRWTYHDGEVNTDTGRFTVLLVKTDENLKIQRLNYE